MEIRKYFFLSLGVILIDQLTKLLVHFYMDMGSFGQIKLIGDWFKLHYTLNPGMAFGIQWGTDYGKLILTLFRIVAMTGIGYYLYYMAKTEKAHPGFLWCVALILGGAVGNVIDSTFYGILLNNTPYNAPFDLFHGQVIDMIYVDIWEGHLPSWIPFWGDKYMALWPIFNIADSAIFIGVSIILIRQGVFFKEVETTTEPRD